MSHDVRICGICYDRAAVRLVRRGVNRRIVSQLRDASTLATAQLAVLQSATEQQIAALNRAF